MGQELAAENAEERRRMQELLLLVVIPMQFANKCKALGLSTTATAAASRAEGSEEATAAVGRAHLTGL